MSFISHYITILEFNLEPVATKIIALISSNVPEFTYVVHCMSLGKGVNSRDNFQLKRFINKSYTSRLGGIYRLWGIDLTSQLHSLAVIFILTYIGAFLSRDPHKHATCKRVT